MNEAPKPVFSRFFLVRVDVTQDQLDAYSDQQGGSLEEGVPITPEDVVAEEILWADTPYMSLSVIEEYDEAPQVN